MCGSEGFVGWRRDLQLKDLLSEKKSHSAIERLFDDIEQRIRRFWNGFIGKYTRDSMERWIEAFAGFRNGRKSQNER